MPDSYSETTKISYGQNLKNSFSAMIFGLILFLASFAVLWLNEGNNVKQIYKAEYMSKNATEISSDKINRENDNELICVSGEAITDTTLTDDIITVKNSFALKRTVEMYQWKEKVKTQTKDELGGGTTETKTYDYEKVWSSEKINSSNFKLSGHENPDFPIESQDYFAKSGKLGEFKLTEKQTKSMSDYSKYTDLPQSFHYNIYENAYYKSKEPSNPKIGDIRISYDYIPSGIKISIIGQQKSDNTITSMALKDSSVYLQMSGEKTKNEMIESFRLGNKLFTNFVRFIGWLLMFIGLNMLINPLIVLLKVLPIASKIAGFITGGIMFLISLALSLLTISIAWFAYRPFMSAVLLVVIAGIIFIIKTKLKPNSQQ